MKRQSGFTIVEILVALTVSLLLIGGVAQVFSGNRETYRLQSGLANLQENARFAVETLRRELSMAGYPGEARFMPFDLASTGDGGGNKSDSVGVRHLTDRSCAGSVVAEQIWTRTFTVVKNPVTGVSSLRCDDIELIDGVENMQLLYGVDTDPGTARDFLPNKYVTADMVAAEEWESRVTAVRFGLLISSLEPVSREPDGSAFTLLDAPEIPAANDLLRRRIYFGTVAKRNRPIL